MTQRRIGFTLTALAGALLLFAAVPGAASAAFTFNWSTAQMVTDPAGDLLSGNTSYAGRDLVAAWHGYANGFNYFRIDLLAAPSASFPPGYADTYGIFINSKSGGAPSADAYVPGNLQGIDYIVSVDVDLAKCSRLVWDADLQIWKHDEFKNSDNLQFQLTNGGKSLEWKVRDGHGNPTIGSSFTWWAASMLPGNESGVGKQTYDVMATPIPNAAWLLGTGVLALIGLKRRRPKS